MLILDRVGIVEMTRKTHAVAESIERHVRSLDALHLATAILIGAPVTVTGLAFLLGAAGLLLIRRSRLATA